MKEKVIGSSYSWRRSYKINNTKKGRTNSLPAEEPDLRKIVRYQISASDFMQAYSRFSVFHQGNKITLKLTREALYLCTKRKENRCEAKVKLKKPLKYFGVDAIAFSASSELFSKLVAQFATKKYFGLEDDDIIQFQMREILSSDSGLKIPKTADLWKVGVGACQITWPLRCEGECEILKVVGQGVQINVEAVRASLDWVMAIAEDDRLVAGTSAVQITECLAQGGPSLPLRTIYDARLEGINFWVRRTEARIIVEALKTFSPITYLLQSEDTFIFHDDIVVCEMRAGTKAKKLDQGKPPANARFSIAGEGLRRLVWAAKPQVGNPLSGIELRLGNNDPTRLDLLIAVPGGKARISCTISEFEKLSDQEVNPGDSIISAKHLDALDPLSETGQVLVSIFKKGVLLEELVEGRRTQTALPYFGKR